MSLAQWTDENLDALRQVGDEPADAVMRELDEVHERKAVNALMRMMVDNDDMPPDELPDVVEVYLNTGDDLPTWINPQQIQRGSAMFAQYGPEITLLLFGASLPVLYAAQRGAPVLTMTGRMMTDLQRRIIETAQFVMDVMEPGAFEPDGRGIRTTQKVRLMHAAVRFFIQNNPKWSARWQPAWGVPINQEDLAGTILSFSTTVIWGLEKSNIVLSDEEKEAYMHVWKVVGYILGIQEDLLPTNFAESEQMMRIWMQRNHAESEAGTALMHALTSFMYERVPGRMFDRVTTNWVRYWNGDAFADMLDVPPYNWTVAINHTMRFLWGIQSRTENTVPLIAYINRFWSMKLMNALLHMERNGKRAEFRIPKGLQQEWGM